MLVGNLTERRATSGSSVLVMHPCLKPGKVERIDTLDMTLVLDIIF